MVQIHIAHLKMLEEQQLISKEDAQKIGAAISQLDLEFLKSRIISRNLKIYFSISKIN